MVDFSMAIHVHVCCVYGQKWRQLPQSGGLIVGAYLPSFYEGLSRKFWSAENFGPRTQIFGKIGPGG